MDKTDDAAPRTWPRIRAILDLVLDLAPAQRAEGLDAACEGEDDLRRQVLSMLDAYDEDTAILNRPVVGPAQGADQLEMDAEIGAYRILERIGDGGMGTVYLASRSDDAFTRKVAIKLIRRGWASAEEVRRFRGERQILADLEHPSIARLLDGGNTADGRPYLVMEYVEGRPIDAWCRQRDLGVEEILDLFLQVCDAVQFAHQRLIVHRDLKPSNILVSEDGQVKLLDFGIAKILHPAGFDATVLPTREGAAPMTPAYASPEQVRGLTVTTATDVYALGLLLYLLLTGDLPYRVDSGDLSSLVDAVCHRDVAPPSGKLGSEGASGRSAIRPGMLRGDLDAIVLKALAKEPERRYAGAEQLADDLRRFLDRRPVRARQGTWLYDTGKFLRRHRLALSAAAVVFAVLVGSVLVLLGQQERLVAERNRALHEQQTAESVTGFLVELFELPDPGRSLGESVSARDLLDKSAQTIQEDLAAEPELLSELLGVLGRTYANLGQLPEARELTTAALELGRERRGFASEAKVDAGDVERVELLLQFSDVAAQQGRYTEAADAAREALEEARVHHPADDALLARSLAELAYLELCLGRFGPARSLFDDAIRVARAAGDPATLALALERFAELRTETGEPDAALELYRQARELRLEVSGPNHPDVALLDGSIADLQARAGDDGERALDQVVERQRELYGGDHPVLATSLNNLGLVALDRGETERAEELLLESLEMKRRVFGPSHPKIATTLANLGHLEARRRDYAASESRYSEALEIFDRELGPSHPDRAFSLANLGRIQLALDRYEVAQTSLEEALAVVVQSLGSGHSRALAIRNNLGELARRDGRPEEALRWLLEAVEEAQADATRSHDNLSTVLFNLAALEAAQGDRDAAALHYAEVAEDLGDELLGLYALTHLARLRLEQGDVVQALEDARRARSGLETMDGQVRWALSAQRTIGLALLDQGKVAEATELFRDRLERLRPISEPDSKGMLLAEADLARALEIRGGDSSRGEAGREDSNRGGDDE